MRTYIPKTHTRLDLWAPSGHQIACPYKVSAFSLSELRHYSHVNQGTATYFNVVLSSGETYENIMWSYINTTSESANIKGMVAFLDEKVDVWLDGELQERPTISLK